MKKTLMTVAALITVIGAAFAAGNGTAKERVKVVPSSGNVYRVLYDADEESIVKVRVKDADGNLVYADRIKTKEGFMKPYNLTELKPGQYTIVLTDKFGQFEQAVKVAAR